MVNGIQFKRFDGSNGTPPFTFLQGEPILDFYNKQVKIASGESDSWEDMIEFAILNSNGKISVSMIDGELVGGMQYKGTFDPATGTAPTPAAQGYYYIADGEGTIDTTSFATGDWLVYRDELNWDKIDNSEPPITWNSIVNKPSYYTPATHDSSYHSDIYLTPETGVTSALLPVIGDASYNTLQDYLNIMSFTGKFTGGIITDGGMGYASVTAGSGFIRTTESNIGPFRSFDWEGNSTVVLTDSVVNYVYVSYNDGSPIVTATTNRDILLNANTVILGRVYKSGTDINIINSGTEVSNLLTTIINKEILTSGFSHISGAVLSNPANLTIQTTDGYFFFGLNQIITPGKNTNEGDTFTACYRDGSGGWIDVTSQTSIDTVYYDDGSGTLAPINNNKYAVHWVYILYDGTLHLQYGQRGDMTLAEAETEQPPETQPLLSSFGVLIGKVIVSENAITIEKIQTAWETTFSYTAPSDHAGLTNLDYDTSGHIGFAPIDSPGFTGVPTAPTATLGTNNEQIATTSFVQSLVSSGGSSGPSTEYINRTLEGVVYETTLMYWRAPTTCVINSCSMSLSSNPSATGSYCKVQVTKNGPLETDSIFEFDVAMNISDVTTSINGLYTGIGTLDSEQTTLVANDVIWFRVNQSDTGSADLLIQMEVTFI